VNHIIPSKPLFDVALAPEVTPLGTGAIIAIVLAAVVAVVAVVFIVRANRKKKAAGAAPPTDAPK
jgi:hypothetical protein